MEIKMAKKTYSTKALKKLAVLEEEKTRAEILSRYAPMHINTAVNYFEHKLEIEAKIRSLLFNESNELELAYKWKLIKHTNKKVKKVKKVKKLTLKKGKRK
jgi:hypothetical protein